MPTVRTTDSIEGGSPITIGPEGVVAVRRFIVEDIAGDPCEITYLATQTQGIPRRGDAHPKIPFLFCNMVNGKGLDVSKAEVFCTYGQINTTMLPASDKQKGQISVGGTVQEVDTNFDADGELLEVFYDSPDKDSSGNLTGTYTKKSQVATVKKFVPMYTLQFSRRESSAPADKAQQYQGTVNGSAFAGAPKDTMLCMRIYGQSDDGGVTYKVDYEFQYNPDGWFTTLVYIDPTTGAPPSGISLGGSGGGMVERMLYKEQDFNRLFLL